MKSLVGEMFWGLLGNHRLAVKVERDDGHMCDAISLCLEHHFRYPSDYIRQCIEAQRSSGDAITLETVGEMLARSNKASRAVIERLNQTMASMARQKHAVKPTGPYDPLAMGI